MRKNLLLLLIAIIVFSCKKTEKNSPIPVLPDQLSEAQLQSIEAAGIDTISTFDDAKFADGTSMNDWLQNSAVAQKVINGVKDNDGAINPFSLKVNSQSDEKRLFIALMTKFGRKLVQTTTLYPGQIKLAYVYGSRDLTAPATYPGAACQEEKYGLDCSGMIYQMASQSTLNLDAGGSKDYVDVKIWNKAFANSPGFESLQMTDMSALPVLQIEAGDIIVSPSVHMGMVFSNGINKEILNSLGRVTYSCDKNSDKFHGPVISNDITKWVVQNFGTNYHVLRTVLKGGPGLTTAAVSNVTPVSATSGGVITNDGGSAITSRGVCWNTTGMPTITNSKTSDGTGTGTFTSNMTGLITNTTYYVRSYATNNSGTAYGQVESFVTNNSGNPGNSGYYVTFNVDGSPVTFAQNQIRSAGSFLVGNGYLTPIIDNITDIEFQTNGTNLQFELQTAQLPAIKTYTSKNDVTDFVISFNWEYENQANHGDYSYTSINKNAQATVTITSVTNNTIKGTFSATLVNIIDQTSMVTITNGQFYVPYNP